MKKIMLAVMATLATLAASAFSLPTVGDGTEPCVWTRNITGVRAAAKTTGYPMLVVVINDSNEGEGCDHCKSFLEHNRAGIEALAKNYKFYMVLLNYWSGANGYSSLASTYRINFGVYPILPSVSVRAPDGAVSKGWGYPLVDGNIVSRIKDEIEKFAVKKSTFALSAGTTSVKMGSAWTGTITRSGGAKTAGTVSISLSGSAAGDYKAEPSSFDWDSSDGSKTFRVSGPADGEDIRSDDIVVKISATGFEDSKISYGKQQLTVSFKDGQVAKTLEEFKAANEAFASLTASSLWYVPADGSAVLAASSLAANATSTLTWTAPRNGTLELAGKVDGNSTLTANVGGNTYPLTANKQGIHVSKDATVTVTATAATDLKPGELGIKVMAFTADNEAPSFADDVASSVTSYLKFESRVSFAAQSASGEVTYSAKGLPEGLRVTKKGLLKGTPEEKGSFNAIIVASNGYGATTQNVAIAVGAFPSKYKGTYDGIVFDKAKRSIAGGVTWKIAANGKWQASFERAGTKTKLKGVCEIDAAGQPIIDGDGFAAAVMPGLTVWDGVWNGLPVYGKKSERSLSSTWSGVWNGGMSQVPAGYLTANVSGKGKVTIKGKIAGKSKLSAKGQLLVLDEAFVAEYLPSCAVENGGSVGFVRAWKKSSGNVFDGGLMLYANGTLSGVFSFGGRTYDEVFGAKWKAPSLTAFDGAVLGFGNLVEIPVVAEEKKLAPGENDCSAKLSAKKSTGIFKGSFKYNGKKATYEGALFTLGGKLVGMGGGIVGSTAFAVELEAAK